MKRDPVQILDAALEDIRELDDFVEFCEASIQNMEGAERLYTVTRKVVERFGSKVPSKSDDDTESERRLKIAQRSTERARKEIEAGCPYLFRLGVIWLWAILEACFDDLAISFMLDENRWLGMEPLRRIKGSFVEFASASEEQQGELLLESIKLQIAAPLKLGAGRFEEVFNLLGLGGRIDANVARVMVEFSATRNLLVHRRGAVDQSFVRLCPWSKEQVGSVLQITRTKYETFSGAVAWYQLEMIARLTTFATGDSAVPWSQGEKESIVQSLRETQLKYHNAMMRALASLEATNADHVS